METLLAILEYQGTPIQSSHFRRNTNFRGRAVNIGSISPDAAGAKRSRLEVDLQLRFRVCDSVFDVFRAKCWWKSYCGTLPHPARPCPLHMGQKRDLMILASPQTQSYQAMPCFNVLTSTPFTCRCGFGGNNKSETSKTENGSCCHQTSNSLRWLLYTGDWSLHYPLR